MYYSTVDILGSPRLNRALDAVIALTSCISIPSTSQFINLERTHFKNIEQKESIIVFLTHISLIIKIKSSNHP